MFKTSFSKQTCLLLFVLAFLAMPLTAQEISIGESVISVHAGPSRYIGKLIGITNSTDDYCDNLRNGVTWSASYSYLGQISASNPWRFFPGLLYQGTHYKHSESKSSDKITMNYIAPQVGLCYLKPHYNLSLIGGIGYQFYSDNSSVYDKPRKVSMNKVAYNLALSGEYLFTSQWGISAKANCIMTDSESYSVKYHGRKWQVDEPRNNEGGGDLAQLSLSIGLNYHF